MSGIDWNEIGDTVGAFEQDYRHGHAFYAIRNAVEAQLAGREDRLATAEKLVALQADDDGLWFITATAPEAYLQQELRKLHATIEGDTALFRWLGEQP